MTLNSIKLNFLTFDERSLPILISYTVITVITVILRFKMNYQSYQPDQFVDFLHSQYDVVNTLSYSEDLCPLSYEFDHDVMSRPPFRTLVQGSRFWNLWKTATKYYNNWTTFSFLESQEDERNLTDLSNAFSGLFECLRYVWTNIDHSNADDYFLGMNFILPFFTQDLIQYDENIQTVSMPSIYQSMLSSGIQNFILEVWYDFGESFIDTEPIMYDIFDSLFYKANGTIRNIYRYVRSLSDLQVPQHEDEEVFEPFIEPNVLFGDAPLRPLLGECCICFEPKKQDYIITHCRHTACQKCAVEHIRRSPCCWFCRSSLDARTTYLYHGSEEYHNQNKEAEYIGDIASGDLF